MRKSGKNKRPAFQFYCGDFLSDYKVACMSMSQRGIYITLLSYAWIENGLPSDENKLKMICGNPTSWKDDWLAVKECFVLGDDNKYRNGRMERERSHAEKTSMLRSDAGRKGGLARSKNQANAKQKSSTSKEVEVEVDNEVKIDYNEEFNIFWETWKKTGRTENKKRAMDAFVKARKSKVDLKAILDGLKTSIKHWARTGKETQYIPHASTWINGRRWEDEISHVGTVQKLETKTEYIYICESCNTTVHSDSEFKTTELTCDCGGLLLDKWTWEYEKNRKNSINTQTVEPQKEEVEVDEGSSEKEEFLKAFESFSNKLSV